MSYPPNDITSELQDAATDGGIVTLTEDSVFHQVVRIQKPFELDLNGYTLQLYGQDEPVTYDGIVYTGPAGWFLCADNTPLGYFHPTTTWERNNIFMTECEGVNGVSIHDGIIDDNITKLPVKNKNYSTDAWSGAIFCPNVNDSNVVVDNLEIINCYGGLEHWPDPVHIVADNQVLTNYKYGLQNVIPTNPYINAGTPSALEVGSHSNSPQNAVVENIDAVGYLECDGIPYASQFTNVNLTHILIGASVPTGSWGNTVWSNFTVRSPVTAQPAINFNPLGGPYTDWQIRNSIFDGYIKNPKNFQGTWGPDNIPEVLPPSYTTDLIVLGVITGIAIVVILVIYELSRK